MPGRKRRWVPAQRNLLRFPVNATSAFDPSASAPTSFVPGFLCLVSESPTFQPPLMPLSSVEGRHPGASYRVAGSLGTLRWALPAISDVHMESSRLGPRWRPFQVRGDEDGKAGSAGNPKGEQSNCCLCSQYRGDVTCIAIPSTA